MKIKRSFKRIMHLVSVLMLAVSMVGCTEHSNSEITSNSSKKTVVTMMYTQNLNNFEKLVEDTYSDIDLQVEISTSGAINSDSERRLLNDHGTDIITTTLPTGDVQKYTIDLSAESFSERYQSTIMNPVMINDEYHYIPLPGRYYGYILNETLCKQLLGRIPQSNDDLIELMDLGAEQNIGVGEDGIMFALYSQYSSTLGSFFMGLEIPDFLGQANGIEWTSNLSDGNACFSGVWNDCLDNMQIITEKGYFDPKTYIAYTKNTVPVCERMLEGSLMLCYSNSELLLKMNESSDDYEFIMLPLLSDEGNTGWVTSEPNAYLALNNKLQEEENAEVLDASLRVLDLLSTFEGQSAWIEDDTAGKSYLTDYVNDEKKQIPKGLEDYIYGGYVYTLRVPSGILNYFGENMLSVLNGQIDMSEALSAVDDYLVNGSEDIDYRQSVVGSVAQDMLVENYNVRYLETSIGNLITDAVAEYTGAEIAVVNGGAIRASLYEGDVYGADLNTVCPYSSNHIIIAEIKGSLITEMLENSISMTVTDSTRNIPNGRFLQVHGLRYSYKPAVENVSDAELVSVTLADGSALDPEKSYTVALSDYMAGIYGYIDNNGDGYTMINLYSDDVPKSEGITLVEETNVTLADILKEYFANHYDKPVTKECEGRITIIE
jgi:hypothetical protein